MMMPCCYVLANQVFYMSLEFFPSSVLLLFDALLLLLRFLLVSSFLPELSLDFRALIVNIIVSKVRT